MPDTYWTNVITSDIYNLGVAGRYPELQKSLGIIPEPALRDLHRLLQEVGQQIQHEKNHPRMFRGGPRM